MKKIVQNHCIGASTEQLHWANFRGRGINDFKNFVAQLPMFPSTPKRKLKVVKI
jgi:hypothetical protein